MKKEFDTKMVYRVWYGRNCEMEAFFTDKETAEAFAKTVDGHLNRWTWEMKIEK